MEGVVLGLEMIEVAADQRVLKQLRVSILADGGTARTFPLDDVAVAFLDDSVRRDLDSYLRTSLAGKTKNARAFTVTTEGEGDRTLRVGYTRETPVWKATYRILLTGGGRPTLQGWAVVDNTSDDDWVDVQLTLVSGLPVSFTHDLYTPRYVRRPVLEVRETSGVLPPAAEAGFDADASLLSGSAAAAPASVRLTEDQIGRLRPVDRQRGRPASAAMSAAPSTVRHETRERQLGDLFEYAVDRPVTVRRNQSALVPIVLAPFDGRPVLLYQKAARPENPVRCVEFVNSTGLTLEGGPALVLEEGAYAGEAMLDTLKPADTRLVGYAVDLGVRVTDSIDTRSEAVTKVVFKSGQVHLTSAYVATTTYTFAVTGGPAGRGEQVLYLDHPRDGEYDLVEPDSPHETTENTWRFRLTLPAGGPAKFVVRARRPREQVAAVLSTKDATVGVWLEQKLIDPAAAAAIREIAKVQDKRAALLEVQRRLDQERDRIHAEQKRVRENLTALGDRASEKGLRERLVKGLTDQEDRLAAIDAEGKAAAAGLDALSREMAAKVDALEAAGN